MKLIIFLSLFTFNALACMNYIPASSAIHYMNNPGAPGIAKTCQDLPNEECLCFDNISWETAELIDNMVDDTSNPIRNKTDVQACVKENPEPDTQDLLCDELIKNKVCDGDAFINATYTEVYCSKITGYPQINQGKKLVESQVKKDAKIAKDLAEKDIADKIAKGHKARAVCEQVLDLISGYNLERNLTIEQITQMQQVFSNIEFALRSGRPTMAKGLIQSMSVDGTIVTQDMKDSSLKLLVDW